MAGHWVVIETASNQAFVFASNKQAVNVGASELIFQVGMTWVPEAVAQVEKDGARVEEIVLASGKALLIVDTEEHGRAIIRAVTERALHEAPGLQVWGVVDPEPIADRGPDLVRAHRLHAACRASRPSSLLRAPTLPYVEPCRYSGVPATAIGREGTSRYPRGAAVDAAWRRAGVGRSRMATALTAERAVLSADLLDRGVSEAGWIAVVHADGNGVGELFSHLHEVYSGTDYTSRLSAFSAALDEVARQALKDAVDAQTDHSDWLLPIVIGGDDVTVIMDGRVAFDVTEKFLQRFEHHSGQHPAIREVVAAVLAEVAPGEPHPDGMTACAGIAFTKPHHPFSDGYHLAEQLCRSAKAVKNLDRRYSALDFHVLHDSVGRDLGRLRVPLDAGGSPLRLWSGPIVVSDDDGSPFLRAHHASRLHVAMDDQPMLGSGAIHQLREALLAGGATVERAVIERVAKQVCAWAEEPDAAGDYLDAHLWVPEPGSGEIGFSRVLDARELLDMARGTVAGGLRQLVEVAR